MALYDQASKTQGSDSEMNQKVSGNFPVPHFTPCLVRMLRSSIEYSSKAHAEITTMYIYIYICILHYIAHTDSMDVSAITWRFHSNLVPARHYLQNCSILLAGYWYFISPFHHKKETEICFDLFFRWVLRLFVPLVLLFQFLGFCLWKCQASIFKSSFEVGGFSQIHQLMVSQTYSEYCWEHQAS